MYIIHTRSIFWSRLIDDPFLCTLDINKVPSRGAGDGEVLVRGEEDGEPLGAERVQVYHGDGRCSARPAGGIHRARGQNLKTYILPETAVVFCYNFRCDMEGFSSKLICAS